jgi:hypothetical protein
VQAQPTAQEQAAMHEPHTAPLATQTQHETLASQNRQNFASVNQGKPAIAATAKAADFSSHSVIPARAAGGVYHAPAMTPQQARGPSTPINANRPTGASTATPQGQSAGFRPFTPPNANKTAGSNTSGTAGSSTGTGAKQANPATTPEGKENQGFRPFTPPNANNPQGSTTNQPKGTTGGNTTFQPYNKTTTNTTSNPPKTNTAKPTPPPPHKSNPPPPPPHKQNPPKEEHDRDKKL